MHCKPSMVGVVPSYTVEYNTACTVWWAPSRLSATLSGTETPHPHPTQAEGQGRDGDQWERGVADCEAWVFPSTEGVAHSIVGYHLVRGGSYQARWEPPLAWCG